VHVTVSLGVAERNERHATPAAVLRAADKALYRAKDKGRDRVSL
jgi:diguanylate cyclase (GGDEF)-like protein